MEFVGDGEDDADEERNETDAPVASGGENRAAHDNCEKDKDEIDSGVEDFAQGCINECGGVIDLFVGKVNVGDVMIIGDNEDALDRRIVDSDTCVIGLERAHAG